MAVAVVFAVPLLLWRDFTPDNELRYLSIADEAIRNGGIFTFSNHGVPYADKPPLYIWLLMACRRLAGGWTMWLVGLLSFVPAVLSAVFIDGLVRGLMPLRYRLSAFAVLLSSGLYSGCALVARMDMLMTMFIVLSVREFYRLYVSSERCLSQRLLFPLYMFLALFTKGPFGIILPVAGITLFLDVKKELRRWPEFFGFTTWGVLVLFSAAWFTAVYIEGGADYLNNLVFHQTVDRAVDAFHHKRPFYYYCVALLYSLAPWTIIIIGAIAASLKAKILKSDIAKLFFAMSAASFFVLSCVSSKLAIYMLPMFPFMVCLAMLHIQRFETAWFIRFGLMLPAAFFSVALPVFVLLVNYFSLSVYGETGVYMAATVLTIVGLSSFWMLMCKHRLDVTVCLMSFGMGLAVFFVGLSVNNLNRTIGYGEECKRAEKLSAQTGARILVDNSLKNAADMDVYLHSFTLIQVNRIDTCHGSDKAVLITGGDRADKLKCRLVTIDKEQIK